MGNNKVSNILAIIPARSGSKEISGKNKIELLGKPLISYSVNTALSSKHVNKVIVSSDDKEILALCEKLQVETIKRPKKYAQNNSPIDLALKHVLDKLENNYIPDLIVLLQPTSPLRKVETVDRAIKEFIKKGKDYDSLIPLHRIESKIGKIKKKMYYSFNNLGKQRQELKPYYKECGTVFIFRPDVIRRGKYYGEKIFPFIVESNIEAIDIDDMFDLKLAEFYLKGRTYEKS